MTKLKLSLIVITLLTFVLNDAFCQGCSDAGFCTINNFKPNSKLSTEGSNNHLKFGLFFGKADHSIAVYGNYIEYSRQLNQKFGIDAKLTTLAQNGNDISVFGFSDIFLNANYRASDKMHLTLGAKLPLSKANKIHNNLPLPMNYQASLGTFDLIFGIGYEVAKIQLVAAIQQPLTQNENQFLASEWPSDSKLTAIQSTNQFQRSGDVLVRVSYPIKINSKLKLTPSLLPIYHLKNDNYTDEFNIKKEIIGSKGLTLNGNVYFDYEINPKNAIQINIGTPFVVREARPDGLTRSFIANLEYKIIF